MSSRDFFRSPPTHVADEKHYRSAPHAYGLTVVMLWAGIGGMLWLARDLAGQGRWPAAGVFFLVAGLLAIGLVYVSTVRVAIDARTIVRTWLGGRRLIVLEDTARLGLWQYKGTLSLTIRDTKKRSIRLTSDTFDWQDIRCMHRDILLALGLDSEPMWPQSPRYLGFLDVEQVLRYKRSQVESSEQ